MSYFAKSPRAEASRKNGAKSKGPVTVDGKACASRNSLKHGLRAKTTVLLEGEDEAAFLAMDHGLKADLQPRGALETLLTSRLAIAAWRMDRIEADLLKPANGARASTLGEKFTRDRYGPQAIDCLIRYRGTTQTEFWRSLAALRALQTQKDETVIEEAQHRANLPVDVMQPNYIGPQVDKGVICLEPDEPEKR